MIEQPRRCWPRGWTQTNLPLVLADPRVQPQNNQETIFEGARLIAGGFFKLLET